MALFTETAEAALPLFRELAPDGQGGWMRGADGQPLLLSGAEALRVWIRKALHPQSERFARCAYSASYGNELAALSGAPGAESRGRLAAMIRGALLVNPYITGAGDFTFTQEGVLLRVSFRVDTVYGALTAESEVKLS